MFNLSNIRNRFVTVALIVISFMFIPGTRTKSASLEYTKPVQENPESGQLEVDERSIPAFYGSNFWREKTLPPDKILPTGATSRGNIAEAPKNIQERLATGTSTQNVVCVTIINKYRPETLILIKIGSEIEAIFPGQTKTIRSTGLPITIMTQKHPEWIQRQRKKKVWPNLAEILEKIIDTQ